MAWFYLLISGIFEVSFTTCMKFHGPVAVTLFVMFAVLSVCMLNLAMRTLPLGTCYAVFSAIGAVGTAAVGIAFFDEPATPARLCLLVLIVAVMIGLRLVSSEATQDARGR